MPGSNNRAIAKARELPADCLILDLEDAVDPTKKAAARENICSEIEQGGFGHREVIVRINALNTPWGRDDLISAAGSGADAILLPKVESAADIQSACDLLDSVDASEMPVWAMAETPRGIINLDSIAGHEKLDVIVMGTSDLAKDLRVSPLGDRLGLLHALSSAVLAARANGVDIIDGVHLALDDADGFLAACAQGHELGFDGKSLIHPRQIAPANEIFGISQSEAEHASEIVTAWQEASAGHKGVIVVRGQLVEQLHVEEAQRLLKLHAKITEREQQT